MWKVREREELTVLLGGPLGSNSLYGAATSVLKKKGSDAQVIWERGWEPPTMFKFD